MEPREGLPASPLWGSSTKETRTGCFLHGQGFPRAPTHHVSAAHGHRLAPDVEVRKLMHATPSSQKLKSS